MSIENHPTLGAIIVPATRPTGFEAGNAPAAAPAIPIEDFGDRRVFVHLESGLPAIFGDLYYDQSPDGPTKAYMTLNVSDAAVATFSDRHGLAPRALRAFRDQAQFGASMLAPADALHP